MEDLLGVLNDTPKVDWKTHPRCRWWEDECSKELPIPVELIPFCIQLVLQVWVVDIQPNLQHTLVEAQSFVLCADNVNVELVIERPK